MKIPLQLFRALSFMLSAAGQDKVPVMMRPFNCNQLLLTLHPWLLGRIGKGFPVGWDVQKGGDWHMHSAGGKANGNRCFGGQLGNT